MTYIHMEDECTSQKPVFSPLVPASWSHALVRLLAHSVAVSLMIESFVGIKRSMRRTFVFFLFYLSRFRICQFVEFVRCLHRGSQSYGFKFGQVFEPELMFLGRVAQCVGTSIGVLHCWTSIWGAPGTALTIDCYCLLIRCMLNRGL